MRPMLAATADEEIIRQHLPIGGKDKPRHPVFLGMRDSEDM